jgi:hypothetical protein
VPGVGATMILNVAVAALSKKILASCTHDCPEQVEVFAQRPYYSGYPQLMNFSTTKWNPDADPKSPWTIEINTSVITPLLYRWSCMCVIEVINKLDALKRMKLTHRD